MADMLIVKLTVETTYADGEFFMDYSQKVMLPVEELIALERLMLEKQSAWLDKAEAVRAAKKGNVSTSPASTIKA